MTASESPLARTRRARRMYRELAATYPYAHCELDFDSPLQLLVATVLSAQTTDVRVNQVTPVLFGRWPTAGDLAAAPVEQMEEVLHPLGFFRAKTRSTQALAAKLISDFGGEVPRTQRELVTLPGVGRKTANVVLGNAFGVPGITVDTHFARLTERMGWVAGGTPEQIEAAIGELFPKKEWTQLSHVVIFHGRRMCHARRPACGVCPVARQCPSFGIGEVDPERARGLLKYEMAPS